MFGQKSQISQAYISKLTRGKSISNNDDKSLLEYYQAMSSLRNLPRHSAIAVACAKGNLYFF